MMNRYVLIFLCSLLMLSAAHAFDYDRLNSSAGAYFYGSHSYLYEAPINDDLNLPVCHPNITVGDKVDLVYYTHSGNLTRSVLDYRPEITGLQGNCTHVRFDLSARKALYPGYVMVKVIQGNTSIGFDEIFAFNGSYEITVDVEAPPKEYFFSPKIIYDQNMTPITRKAPYLMTSMIYNSSILGEDVLNPVGALSFIGALRGGEEVIVNGIRSLEIKVYDPCGTINESGYYIMNRSRFNLNSSCVRIEEAEDVVLNFAGELLDGDNNQSKTRNRCPIEIRNSRSVVVEDINSQEFYHGLCVYNSTVDVIESNSGYHKGGALVTDRSRVKFVQFRFSDNEEDIIANGSSTVELVDVNFTNAVVSSIFHDSTVKTVDTPPPKPDNDYLIELGQYIEYDRLTDESYAQISFHYDIPLPSEVAAENISIYKYNGTWKTTFNNATNTTRTGWQDGSWQKLFTLISPSEQLIIGPNITEFSVFSPFATTKDPVTEPVPDPQPDPQSGSGSGGGGSFADPEETEDLPTYAEVVQLNLTLPDNISVMQGAIEELPFTLENIGNITAYELTVSASPIRGWEITNQSTARIDVNSSFEDSLLVSPYEKEKVGEYFLPIRVFSEGKEFIRDYVKVVVLPRGQLSRLKIIEYPPLVRMAPDSTTELSFLVENIGDRDFRYITIEPEDLDCLKTITGSADVLSGETKQITYELESGGRSECRGNMLFKDDGETIAFAPIRVIVETPSETEDAGHEYILLIILAIWSILTLYVLRRRRIKNEPPGRKEE